MFIRRIFLDLSLFLLTCIGFVPEAGAATFVYVGSFANNASKGIVYSYQFDPATGGLKLLGFAAESPKPEFLALHPNHKFLYAVNEMASYEGNPTGAVSAFAIDSSTGKLTSLNHVSSHGAGPAHLTVDRTGKYVLVANYSGGSVAVFPVLEDGKLGDASEFRQHKGSGLNPVRQEAAHAHAVIMAPDNRFALVADLGIDQVFAYPFDATAGTFGKPRITKVKPGSGPRHLVFSSSGKFLYLLNELLSSVTVFSYAAPDGTLTELQTISTLSQKFAGTSAAAEIALHPSGKFLYASNRGEDSFAVFAINPAKGTLTLVEDVPTQGKTPRNFALDPSGAWLLVANQESNNIVTFRIDPATGRLTPTGQIAQVAVPMCVQFDAPAGENGK